MEFRIYAPRKGAGSLVVVGRGFESALGSLGLVAGIVPVDSCQTDRLYRGIGASDAIVIGQPSWLRIAQLGRHQRVWFEYAANSRNLTTALSSQMLSMADGVLTPSAYSAQCLRRHLPEEFIHVVRHGVDTRFRPNGDHDRGCVFQILHHAGSSIERKGTLELVEAFASWSHRDDAQLTISGPLSIVGEIPSRINPEMLKNVTPAVMQGNWPDESITQYQRAHLVCQPSRCEGFGMVPVEARACGVPVALTMATGHLEHTNVGDPGVVPIGVGPEAPLQAELGAMAPTVDSEAILQALNEAWDSHDELAKAALDASASVRQDWSWIKQVQPFIDILRQNDQLGTAPGT